MCIKEVTDFQAQYKHLNQGISVVAPVNWRQKWKTLQKQYNHIYLTLYV